MSNPLRVAVAGLGNVGVGVVKILEKHKELIADRAGREIVITTVCARNKNVDRGVDLSSYEWVDDATQLAAMDNVDIVIELIGGEDGVALKVAKNTLNNSKSFVTANKAMIAHHGCELADLAQENDVALRFEAAVAGGIPIIKAIGEGLAANELNLVYGIMNGTTNYMLSQMEARGLSYTEILAETEELGYLEADPALDLDGIDAAHKLAILSSVAFGTKTDFDNIHIEGIRNIETVDIEYAKELGYRIKLLGITKYEEGNLSQRVHPVMIDRNLPIAGVMDGLMRLWLMVILLIELFIRAAAQARGRRLPQLLPTLLILLVVITVRHFLNRRKNLLPQILYQLNKDLVNIIFAFMFRIRPVLSPILRHH